MAKNMREILIPKSFAGEEPNLFVGVNGVSFLLPRGKVSKVPDYVAAEVERAMQAQETMDETVSRLLEASK